MSLLTDDFNRADGEVGNGWTERRGQWRISSNQVTGDTILLPPEPTEFDPARFLLLTRDTGYNPGLWASVGINLMSYPQGSGQHDNPGICLRWVDNDNWLAVIFDPDQELSPQSAHIVFYQCVSGVVSVLADWDLGATFTGGERLSAILGGNDITVVFDGTTIGQVTTSAGNTSVEHGLACDTMGQPTSSYWDNLAVDEVEEPGEDVTPGTPAQGHDPTPHLRHGSGRRGVARRMR